MVLLIVDTQKLITNEKLYRFEDLVANVRTLIHTARQNNIEVIYIRHDDGEDKPLTKGTDGFEICEAFAPNEGEMIFDKTVNSPFRDTGLLEYLKSPNLRPRAKYSPWAYAASPHCCKFSLPLLSMNFSSTSIPTISAKNIV